MRMLTKVINTLFGPAIDPSRAEALLQELREAREEGKRIRESKPFHDPLTSSFHAPRRVVVTHRKKERS